MIFLVHVTWLLCTWLCSLCYIYLGVQSCWASLFYNIFIISMSMSFQTVSWSNYMMFTFESAVCLFSTCLVRFFYQRTLTYSQQRIWNSKRVNRMKNVGMMHICTFVFSLCMFMYTYVTSL